MASIRNKRKQDEDDHRSIATNETSLACYCCGKKGHTSPQSPEKDIRRRAQWAIRQAEQHLQAEANRDDNNHDHESITLNATSRTNRSFQNKGWSGLQVNLMNHDDD